MVGGYQKSHGRCSYPSSGTQHTGVYRCLTKRLGSSLKRDSVKWSLVKQGSPAPHQCIGAKSCSSSPKGLSGTLTRSNSAHLFRQQHSSSLSEQRRRHTFHRDVCSYLENSCIHKFQKNPDKGKTRTWIPKRHSRLSITKGQGHTDGVVTSPTDIQPNLQSLAHTNFQKSELIPMQKLDFLGYHFDFQRGLVFPTQKKLDRLNAQTVSIRKSLVLTPRKLMSLIGTLASLEKTVPLGRLHMRPFQWYLKSHWKFPQSLDIRIPGQEIS